jgi:hypothetical protein
MIFGELQKRTQSLLLLFLTSCRTKVILKQQGLVELEERQGETGAGRVKGRHVKKKQEGMQAAGTYRDKPYSI